MKYYKFLQPLFFSPGNWSAVVNDYFTYSTETLRGRFKEFDFQVPLSYIQELLADLNIEEVSFYDYLVLQGFPPIESLVDPDDIAEAIFANPTLYDELVADVAAALAADVDFQALVEGDQGIPGTPGIDGVDGVSPTAQSVADILAADTAFQDSVEGEQGIQGIQGTQGLLGPVGPGGISFGSDDLTSVTVSNGDKITSGSVFAPVPDAEISVLTTGILDRLLIIVNAVGFAASNDDKQKIMCLDLEVDGVRQGGTFSGLIAIELLPTSFQNCSFQYITPPLGPTTHLIKLLFKAPDSARVGIRANTATNQIRLYCIPF